MTNVKWKSYTSFTVEGKPYKSDGKIFDKDPTLLQRIMNMPAKDRKISIHSAYNMYWQEIMSCLLDDCSADKAGDVNSQDWVTWISKQGFQIILTGDEYEI